MGHFQPSSSEPTLDVETLVRFAAVEDGLVATNFLGDEVESLDEAKTELLALLVFGDGDILDVTHKAKTVDAVPGKFLTSAIGIFYVMFSLAKFSLFFLEGRRVIQLPLYKQSSCSYDLPFGGVFNDEDVVCIL